MKKISWFLIGIILLSACSTQDNNGNDPESNQTNSNEPSETTYEFEQGEADEFNLLAHSYQITVDDSFEQISQYERGTTADDMFFWHKPSAKDYSFKLETTPEMLQENVPTIELTPINKKLYVYKREYYTSNVSGSEAQKIKSDIKQDVAEKSDEFLEKMKEKSIRTAEGEPTVHTNEEKAIGPFRYMIESQTEQGATHYDLIGEGQKDYLRATLSIPEDMDDNMLDNMLAALKTITYDQDDFEPDAMQDNPSKLSYEPAENLKGSYPEVGYTFEKPETAVFKHSFPVYHAYRYTYGTVYEESIEKEHYGLRSSDLDIRVAKADNARNREKELVNKVKDDFVTYQDDAAQSITYLHENDDFDTGVFTTAVRVEFNAYEKYWFLKEVNGHVYEVRFDLAFEAPEYEELLDDYLNVIRTFEIKT